MFTLFSPRFDYHSSCPFFLLFYRNELSILTGLYFTRRNTSFVIDPFLPIFPFSRSSSCPFSFPPPSPPLRPSHLHALFPSSSIMCITPAQYSILQVADLRVRLGYIPRSIRSRPVFSSFRLPPSFYPYRTAAPHFKTGRKNGTRLIFFSSTLFPLFDSEILSYTRYVFVSLTLA